MSFGDFHFTETCIRSQDWHELAVAKINSRLIDCDSIHEHVRQRSEAILQQEVNLCMHIGATCILIDMPTKGDRIENFAAILLRLMSTHSSQMKILLRLTVPADATLAEKIFRRYLDFK